MNPSDQARQVGVVDSWLAQYRITGVATNPAASVILVDTGQLAAGHYDVYLFLAFSAALAPDQLYFEWRNAANSATLVYFNVFGAGAGCESFTLKNLKVAANERFRAEVGTAFTGNLRGTIIAVRRA